MNYGRKVLATMLLLGSALVVTSELQTHSGAIAASTSSASIGRGNSLIAGSVLELQVGGVAGIPADASAAVLNITAVNPAAAGYLTVYPCGQPQPNASNLNYAPGQTIPNLTITKLGTNGKICITSLATTDVLADAAGYFPATADYTSITNPTRILDTRNGTGSARARLAAGQSLQLQVGGVAGIPADASAAVLNITAVNPAAAGYLTVYPCGQPQPNASNLNYAPGQTIPNLTITKLGTNGKICITSLATTDVLADAAGYFPATADYTSITNPTRILDTRNGTGSARARLAAGQSLQLQVGGVAGIPADASAAVLNITAVNPAAAGYLTVYPCGQPQPNASNLNYAPGQTIPNLTITKLGTNGKICITSLATTDVLADAAGYFPATADYTSITNPTRILDTRNGTGSPGGPVTGGLSSQCVFMKADQPVHRAFCDSFDQPTPGGANRRSGDLEPILWGVSRTNLAIDLGQGEGNDFVPVNLEGCGPAQSVLPPRDVQICNGRLISAINDNGGQPDLAMYPKQPFDIAGGRTGTVVFDVSADSDGPHDVWPEFWWTDQPVPTPHGHLSGQGSFARNSLGFSMASDQCPNGTSVDKIMVTRNYAYEEIPFTRTGCLTKGNATGNLNHIEIRINQNHVEIWGTDAGTTTIHQLAVADNANITMTRGLVWLEHVAYNACKFGTHCQHSFAWDNLGFDGPTTYRDLSFDVPDSNVPNGNAVGLGYVVSDTLALPVEGVFRKQAPTSALVTFNWFAYDQAVPSFRVNGGPWHDTTWPYTTDDPRYMTYVWRTLGVKIDPQETQDGTNTIEFRTNGARTLLANINLILVAGAPVPSS